MSALNILNSDFFEATSTDSPMLRWHRAILKAMDLNGSDLVTEAEPGVFTVQSASGPHKYQVRMIGDAEDFVCECPSGTYSAPCYHAASAYLYRLGQLSEEPD